MKSEWLPYTVLHIASLLAPSNQRAEWVKEWQSELWYIPRRGATLFCLGAFRDALWLRRNNLNPVKRTRIHLESPLSCLAFLATFAAVSIFILVCLPAPGPLTPTSHLRARDLAGGCMGTLMLSCLVLPATLAVGRAAANRPPMSWPSRLRRGIFLGLKTALVQPIMFCGAIVMVLIGTVPVAPQVLCFAAWILPLRWVLTDQWRRCPVCLRLLTDPVRIGTPSRTFLEWYGVESMCSRGHGLLLVPEISPSYSGEQQWLKLDGSWSGLFSGAAGVRQP
jgi:hypothetical protein